MATTNQERIGKAMELLRAGLAPCVEREFESQYQADAATPGKSCTWPGSSARK